MGLNPEQVLAVNSRRGRILVIAAPGSGKTKVAVQRVIDIMKSGVSARRILSTTFTREAASEMSNRAAKYLLGISVAPQARLDKAKRDFHLEVPYGHHIFCTFHSLALRFIKSNQREHFAHLAAHVLASGTETGRALRTAMTQAGLKPKQKRDLISFISKCKRTRISPNTAAEKAEQEGGGEYAAKYADAYWHYERVLGEFGVLDFDSLLVETARLLEKNPEVRASWQFEYLQVDEAQDTDVLQWAIIDMLSQQHGNLFVVGDENQGMYNFRGAESNLQENFLRRYPGARVLILPENYRSTGEIVDLCKEVAPLQNDTVKNLRTANFRGERPTFTAYGTEDEEAQWTLRKVAEPPVTAILARTNAQLQPYEDGCTDRGIPFHILGKGGYWRQHEVETCMAFVRCLVAPTEKALVKVIRAPYDIVRAKRDEKDDVIKWISEQKRGGINENKLLDNLRRCGHPTFRNLPNFFDSARTVRGRCGEIVQKLFERAGAVGYYKEKDDEDMPDNNRFENINRLITIAEKFGTDLGKFLKFAERVRRENKAAKDALTLSTIHKAKGLEWKDVFVVGVNEGKLPSAYCVSEADFLEERKVFFVALSRAARTLTVSCSGAPSEFMLTLPPGYKLNRLEMPDGGIPETAVDILHRFMVESEPVVSE